MRRFSNEVAKLLERERRDDSITEPMRAQALEAREAGGIIHPPNAGFRLSEREARLVADANITLSTQKARKSRNGRPTVVFDPDRGRIRRARMQSQAARNSKRGWHATPTGPSRPWFDCSPAMRPSLSATAPPIVPCARATRQGLHVDAGYGQHSLDQMFFLPPAAMEKPERSSLKILERLSQQRPAASQRAPF